MEWPVRLAAQVLGAATRTVALERALDDAGRLFAAPMRLLLPACVSRAGDEAVYRGLTEAHFSEYFHCWRERDPVLLAARARYTAVRDRDLAILRTASGSDFARRIGGGPYMIVPLYDQSGASAGTLHMWRRLGASGYEPSDALQAMAFSAFLSVTLATRLPDTSATCTLAPREHQVAVLAASGHSNKEIAQQLDLAEETVKQTLRRVYRKLDVSGRTALAARYARAGFQL